MFLTRLYTRWRHWHGPIFRLLQSRSRTNRAPHLSAVKAWRSLLHTATTVYMSRPVPSSAVTDTSEWELYAARMPPEFSKLEGVACRTAISDGPWRFRDRRISPRAPSAVAETWSRDRAAWLDFAQ